MGIYFNPDNGSFAKDKRNEIYIDKTGLISFLNKKIKTSGNCICVSHARRFGKSHAAGMIDAYYSLGSDSRELFSGTEIINDSSFDEHLNKYNVVHLDVSSFTDRYRDNLVEKVTEILCKDISQSLQIGIDITEPISTILSKVYLETKVPFIIIIDEWDCVIRNCADDQKLVHKYLHFLHGLFKSEESKQFLALAYITGILPIKKIQDESALNNFREFTMVSSSPITKYYGFTEDEVKQLCERYGMDFDTIKAWYNGYLIDGMHMYNPNSVSLAMEYQKIDSYWKNTSSFSSINTFITMNYDGLKDDVMSMLAGDNVRVNVDTFQNDLANVRSKDEVLTALIHLGYIAYDLESKKAFIPNYEVSKAFEMALITGSWTEIAKAISSCDELLDATIEKNEERVAELVELAHETYTSILKYNDENSLSCVLTMAYFTAPAYYNIVRELPTGKGFADLALIPRANAGKRPAMIIELKYDQPVDTAIKQIKDKRYVGSLKDYKDNILLVGIVYDKETKEHKCIIE